MWRRTWLVFSQAVTVAVALLFVLSTFKPEWLRQGLWPGALPGPSVSVAPAGAATAAAGPAATSSGPVAFQSASYAVAAKQASAAVVSIVATRATRSPADEAHQRFFGRGSNAPLRGLGSGVIAAPEGYVLTNHHVIEGATEVEVQLADGRTAGARIVGTDADTDLAVLKIELDRLPVIRFAEVAALQVGDVVLAIGNPFDVGQTVTAGIVSATGRQGLGLSTYENFIQTDAAINPGNSGGALVDVRGDLLGINTAIFQQRGGGNVGIGFAIPADTARQVMQDLVRDGRVTRGWLGVETRSLTPEYAESFKLAVREGALIVGVLQDGAADKAGVRPGDVVLAVGATRIASTSQLMAAVAALRPGAQVALTVQRGPQALELTAQVAQRPAAAARR
jgi:serine protease DegQ